MSLNNYNLSLKDYRNSIITGFSGFPYAKRHWHASNQPGIRPRVCWGHRSLSLLEAIPVVGGLTALIEKLFAKNVKVTPLESEITAHAAGTLQGGILVQQEHLKDVGNALGTSAEAVVQICVVADGIDSKVYHAATVHLHVSENNQLSVDSTVATYVDGAYQKRIEHNGTNPRHLLHNAKMVVYLSNMNARNRCPDAFYLTQKFLELIKDGIILPHDERFHWSTINVLAHRRNEMVQKISLERGTRYMNQSIDEEDNWSSTGVYNDLPPDSIKRIGKPSLIPATAILRTYPSTEKSHPSSINWST